MCISGCTVSAAVTEITELYFRYRMYSNAAQQSLKAMRHQADGQRISAIVEPFQYTHIFINNMAYISTVLVSFSLLNYEHRLLPFADSHFLSRSHKT